MTTRNWEYQTPDNFDELSRLQQLHAEGMKYTGATNAGPSQVVIVTHTAKQYDLGDGIDYPLTLDLLRLNVEYIGNPNGVWNADKAPDNTVNHIRANLYDVSDLDVQPAIQAKRHAYGAMYLSDFDPYTPFYPAFKNMNADAMLAPMYLSFASAAIVHIVHDNWKQRVGSGDTAEQYVEKTMNYINNEISKLFDDRFQYTVEAYNSPADVKRRHTWSTDVTVGIPQTKWVNRLKIHVDKINQ